MYGDTISITYIFLVNIKHMLEVKFYTWLTTFRMIRHEIYIYIFDRIHKISMPIIKEEIN